MKKHFQKLISPEYKMRTISLSASALVFFLGASIVGINDNLPGISMLVTGIVLFYFSILHPWRKAENYAILIAACVAVLILEWLGIHLFVKMRWEKYLSEAAAMILAFFICLPGVLAGLIGVFICVFRRQKNQ
jgi:hypothetical protein